MKTDPTFPYDKLFPLDGYPGPACLSPAQTGAIVQRALDVWQAQSSQTARGRWRKVLLLAAASFAVAGAAAALLYVGYAEKKPNPALQSASHHPSVPQATTTRALPPLEGVTQNPLATLPESASRSSNPRAIEQPADDLLLLANKLRQQGKWRAAEQTYSRVCIVYPNSPAAYVASIAAASIRLEQLGNPTGALALFNRAINSHPDGALDIEARLGIARSWQRLGEREREIAALKALLQKHSSGPIVQRARERLEAIVGE
jgi:tetratricopeptide (TPR) repeat protein